MKELDELEKQIEIAEEALKKVRDENEKLQDEVDSLWAMMDEITKSDIENWSHLVEELKSDVVEKSLMITKKVADC
jgi:predicted  nucleic acid-binding Zn-ribbon protein